MNLLVCVGLVAERPGVHHVIVLRFTVVLLLSHSLKSTCVSGLSLIGLIDLHGVL